MSTTSKNTILFILTSASKSLQSAPTGWYLPEVAHPYYVLSPHFTIEIASPDGPDPPMDPSSEEQYKDDEECKRFKADEDAQSLLQHAKRLEDINIKQLGDYEAIFYVGGRGAVIDLPTNMKSIGLANEFYRSGRLVSAVCHGPAALVGVTGKDGKSIFDGKVVTGFSTKEENAIGHETDIPFLLEDRVQSLGAKYVKADNVWDPKVVQSDNLITGQNPNSARPLAEKIKENLQVNVKGKK